MSTKNILVHEGIANARNYLFWVIERIQTKATLRHRREEFRHLRTLLRHQRWLREADEERRYVLVRRFGFSINELEGFIQAQMKRFKEAPTEETYRAGVEVVAARLQKTRTIMDDYALGHAVNKNTVKQRRGH